MKIAFDAKRYYHNHTGLGNYSRTLVTALQRLFPEEEYVLYDEKSFRRTFKLGRQAVKDGCNIYHGLSNELPLDSRQNALRTLVTIHDVAWRTFPDMYHFLDRHIYDYKYGWAARHANCVLAISESTKRDVMRFYEVPEERVKVVYQPVAEHFYTPLDKAEAHRMVAEAIPNIPQQFLLSVGSINSRKNLLGTLQALARQKEDSRPPLVVVGSGREYLAKCKEYAQHHLRPHDVIWVQRLADNKVLQALYGEAMAMLYPSHYEGFGLPVVESLLQGTPVLSSTVSSLPEAAGPGALLVDPSNVDEIAHGLQVLIDDASRRKKIAIEGEAFCRKTFDPDTLAKQVMTLYLELFMELKEVSGVKEVKEVKGVKDDSLV